MLKYKSDAEADESFGLRLFLPPGPMAGSKKMGGLAAKVVQKDLAYIKGLLEAGKIRPVIDRRYPLSEVPEALRYLGEGHALGKVVITF
jgi:NADPH:quinone reductase-like Zn-dependent oxidoreductase